MRITGVESTDLFTGSTGRALQVVRVTVAATEDAEEGSPARLRVDGPTVGTREPFVITLGRPGESRTGEVSVVVTGAPGTALPVTVTAESSEHRAALEGSVTAAEPGWTMWMVSHFHYDPVWWSTQGQFTEARLVLPDENGDLPDTRTAFDLVRLHLEKARRDADYKFVLAEVDYLKPHFDAFPGDREFLRSLLSAGRAELVGGTYNEPNTNLTGAESTIRNAVYGTGFQRGVLGGSPESAWMLDAFGFDPGFPGLMAQAGLTSSSWARGPFHQWGPAVNTDMQFPAEFEWLSPDGSGLLTAYMANHYVAGWQLHTATSLDDALAAAYQQFRELAPVAATRNVMLPVGSDHAIPARWVTDVAREWSARYVWPRFVPAIPRDFFAAVRADAEAEPQRYWIMPQTRDMNPLYTGKDVSYADTKVAARLAETAVLEGERLAALAWLQGAPYPAESLDKAWRQLAYGAHHDAITGTESDQVYLDLLAGWREAWERGDSARRDAAQFLAPAGSAGLAVTVFNGLPRSRDAMATATVRLDSPGTPWLSVTDPVTGAAVPALAEGVRRHADGTLAEVTLTFRARAVPPLGFARYPLVSTATAAPAGWTDVGGLSIANDALTVTGTASRAGLGSVVQRATGRELLRGPGNDLVLQEEYQQHPKWNEGPWHLSPKGPGVASSSVPASVQAQRSAVGSRLVATYSLGGLSVTAETLLWDGADRVEFRTHVSGSIGKEHLLRVRFPAALPGGLPVYQTATAVIGRPFGTPEADVASHWWTLDNPAHQWFGLGSVARMSFGAGAGHTAVGVAEVVTPDAVPLSLRASVRGLVASLGRAGVTATVSRPGGTRYGSLHVDSNLPDFRIALGGPSSSAFTAEVLAACDPAVAKRLAQLTAEGGTARLWVPAAKPRTAAFAPTGDVHSADVRGLRDLPVLIVATAAESALGEALAELGRNFATRWVAADVSDGNALTPGDAPLSLDGDIALFNRGTPGGAVTTDGTIWMSLLRSCSAWPSGVWIDGDQRAAPDGSSFQLQHWSHTFRYALAAGGGTDWCGAAFNEAAEDYNHDLLAAAGPSAGAAVGVPGLEILEVPDDVPGSLASRGTAYAAAGAPDMAHPLGAMGYVTLSALKPRGNPLAHGLPGTPPGGREVTVRLRETDGLGGLAGLRLAGGIEAAWCSDLLEESLGEPLEVHDGTALVPIGPFETVTVAARLVAPPAPLDCAAKDKSPSYRTFVAEPGQPVFSRYWLHNKGPAPAGNMPLAVHFSPVRATLGGESGVEEFGGKLTVAAGPSGGSGTVSLDVPAGLTVWVNGAAVDGPLPYAVEPNGFAVWNVSVQAEPGAADGRYFVAARITDGLGQDIEDALLVTVGESGPVQPDLEPEELFFRLQSDTMALADEVSFEALAPSLTLAPGASGAFEVRVASALASELRGEVQLVSPVETWDSAGPWTQSVTAAPGSEAVVRFNVTAPAAAAPGPESWLLAKLMYFGRVRYTEAVRLTIS